MNPPISAEAPARTAPAHDRRTDTHLDGDTGEVTGSYRPAHAAPARPVVDDEGPLLDLTDDDDEVVLSGPANEAGAALGATRRREVGDSADPAPSRSVIVADDMVVLFDDLAEDESSSAATTLVGTRAAARAKRRRRTADAAPKGDTDAIVAWSTEPDEDGQGQANDVTSGATPMARSIATDSDPLALVRSVETAWTAAACWVRRHATVQIAVPCLVLAAVSLVAVVAADGAVQRLGQIVLTAALVTAGVAWAQATGDQRRRQQDLRFRLASGNLERADLTGTVLDGFTLWGQNLRGAKLSGCSADHVLLSGADLRDASLTGSSLRVASLAGADLSGARLYRSDLRGADLTGAIAEGASFELAVLRGALLEGADLSGADLSGADLRGATHDEHTCWEGVVITEDTHLPEDLPTPAR